MVRWRPTPPEAALTAPRLRLARPAALAAALLALAGCARDLELPPAPDGPVLTAIVPAAAFSGELVEIQGSGFAADPASNLVTFPRASARAVGHTGAGVLVRVPLDAGGGAVTVTTPRGTSAPLRGFGWRGLGQLRTGQVMDAAPLLHAPRALYAPGGAPVLDSSLFGGLVGVAPAAFVRPHAFQRPVQAGADLLLVDGGALVRLRPATGASASAALGADVPFYVAHLALPAGDLAAVVGSDAAGGFTLRTLSCPAAPALSLGAASAAAPLAADVLSELVDTGRGRLAAVATAPLAPGAPTLALVDPAVSPPAVTFLPPPPAPLATAPAVIAADPSAGLVAVALASGGVAIADAATLAWRPATVDTLSPSPVTSLAGCAGGCSLFVAAKRADGVALGLSAARAVPAWAVALPSPVAVAVDGGTAWVAGDADNDLAALDVGAGRLLGRRSADLVATARTRAGGAAHRPADLAAGVAEAVAFPVSSPPALVTWELGTGPAAATLPVAPDLVLWDPDLAAFRAAGPQPSAVDALATAGAAGLVAVPTGVEDLRWTPSGPLLAGGHRLSLVSATGLVTVAADLDAPIATPATDADGRVLAVGSMNGAERARLWHPAALAAGGAPAQDVVLPGFALLGFFVDGRPWAAWADPADLSPHAARLAADGTLQDAVAAAPPDGVTSPNGRTVVGFEPGLAGTALTALRIVSTDPANGFATLNRVQLPGPVVSAVFDVRGERLYVVVSGPDRLVLVE